ncbi:MAG: ATP-binding protein, partial [Halobacteriales archaeon]|nr:ATP-binding protein [Halobacteriales archaeon]
MEALGTLVGSSSEARFTFKVQDARLRRGDYVKVPHEDGIMLAQVSALKREKDGLLAEGAVIGRREKGMLTSPKTPFRPGDPVDRADERLTAETLGLGDGRDEDGAYLGLLRGLNIRVSLDIDILVQKHVSVMAKTGAGKSYVVGVLIEELLKRQVPVIIVDPHGEYTSLSQPNNAASETQSMRRFGIKPRAYADRIMEYSPDAKINADAQALRIEGTNLGTRELGELLGGRVNAMQLGLLHQAVKDVATRRKKGYTLQDIIAEVNRSETNAKWTLLGALQYLEGLGLFAEQGTPVTALVKRGQVTVIN